MSDKGEQLFPFTDILQAMKEKNPKSKNQEPGIVYMSWANQSPRGVGITAWSTQMARLGAMNTQNPKKKVFFIKFRALLATSLGQWLCTICSKNVQKYAKIYKNIQK